MDKKSKIKKIINCILFITTIITTIIAIVNVIKLDILPVKHFMIFIGLELIINGVIILFLKSKKLVLFIIGIILSLCTITGNIIVSTYVHKTNSFIEKTFPKYMTISTEYVVVTSNKNEITDFKELSKDQNIEYFKYSRDVNLAMKKLGNYKYNSNDSIAHELSNMDNNPNTYLLISKGDFDYLMESTILYNKDNYKVIKNFIVNRKEKINEEIKDSYTIYLNGTDFTGIMRDFNMLITVNTKTKKILMTPVLRGYYMDVPAYNQKDTLMCLGAYDSNVSREALEKLFDIKIDYTVNVNTNSLIDIVDTIGGVEFCSDYSFTTTHILTDNTYEDKNGTKLTVSEGCREYNGLEALAIARERLNLRNNERGRIENCRKILMSIVKKSMNTTTLTNYDEVLNSYSDLYTTDMNKKVITNLAKTFIDNYGEYEVITQYVDGTDGTAMGHLGSVEVGVTFPDENQVRDASIKIKEVLEGK